MRRFTSWLEFNRSPRTRIGLSVGVPLHAAVVVEAAARPGRSPCLPGNGSEREVREISLIYLFQKKRTPNNAKLGFNIVLN